MPQKPADASECSPPRPALTRSARPAPRRASVCIQTGAQAFQDLEFVGTGKFQLDPFARDGAGIFLTILIDRPFLQPGHHFRAPCIRQAAQKFDQKPPVRQDSSFKGKAERVNRRERFLT